MAFLLFLFVPRHLLGCQKLTSSSRQAASQTLKNSSPKTEHSIQPELERMRLLMQQVREASYVELKDVEIEVRTMKNESDFFRARLRFPDFFFRRRIRYIIKVNPKVLELQAPEEGLKAIVAHELGHVAYLEKRNRLQLLGMVRLVSGNFTARFERRTDLEAISRGYAEGLKAYRQWLYQHVPRKKLNEKQQNYFSPAEIETLISQTKNCPGLVQYWRKNPPRNLKEIEEEPSRSPRLCGDRRPLADEQ